MRKGVLLFTLFLVHFPAMVYAQTANGDYEYKTHMSDPIEPVNRVIWNFNYLVLDNYIYKPVTETYVDWVPDNGRKSVNNFILNFDEPSNMVNNLLLLDFADAGDSVLRFSINSTFGLLGFFDLAEKAGVKRKKESFSNVLGHWYVPHGPYLMLPVVGPRSARKLVGSFVDGLYFPLSYLNFWQSGLKWGLDGLDKRESLLGQEKLLEQSLDPYIFVKEAYIQYEAFKFYENTEDMSLFIEEKQKQQSLQDDQNLEAFMDEID